MPARGMCHEYRALLHAFIRARSMPTATRFQQREWNFKMPCFPRFSSFRYVLKNIDRLLIRIMGYIYIYYNWIMSCNITVYRIRMLQLDYDL